jgi:outer membrane protein assembly factor BamB
MRQSRRQVLAAAGISLLGGCTTLRNAVSGDEKSPPTPFLTEPADWEDPNYDAANTNAAPGYAGPESLNLEPDWSFEFEGEIDGIEGPVVADGQVYFAVNVDGDPDRNHLVALDAQTGDEQWRFSVEDWSLYPPVVAGETAYWVGSSDVLYAVNAADGTVKWRRERTGHNPPIPAHGLILSIGTKHDLPLLEALDPKTGESYWTRREGSRDWSLVAADGEVFYVHLRPETGEQAHELHAIDPLTGETLWKVPREIQIVAAVNETHLLTSYDSQERQQLYAVDKSAERIDWNIEQDLTFGEGRGRQIVAAVTDTRMLVHFDYGRYEQHRIEARETSTGTLLWSIEESGDKTVEYTSPILVGDHVYFVEMRQSNGSERTHTLRVLKLSDGSEQARLPLPGVSVQKPVVADGQLFVLSYHEGGVVRVTAR